MRPGYHNVLHGALTKALKEATMPTPAETFVA